MMKQPLVTRYGALVAMLLLAGCQPANKAEPAMPAVSVQPALVPLAQQEVAVDKSTEAMAAPDSAALQRQQQQLLQQIRQMVGTAAAQRVEQCRMVGFGHKPCGGPAGYLAYSTAHLDEATLLLLVHQYNEMDKTIQVQQGMVSDCAVVIEPAVVLRDGVCQLTSSKQELM